MSFIEKIEQINNIQEFGYNKIKASTQEDLSKILQLTNEGEIKEGSSEIIKETLFDLLKKIYDNNKFLYVRILLNFQKIGDVTDFIEGKFDEETNNQFVNEILQHNLLESVLEEIKLCNYICDDNSNFVSYINTILLDEQEEDKDLELEKIRKNILNGYNILSDLFFEDLETLSNELEKFVSKEKNKHIKDDSLEFEQKAIENFHNDIVVNIKQFTERIKKLKKYIYGTDKKDRIFKNNRLNSFEGIDDENNFIDKIETLDRFEKSILFDLNSIQKSIDSMSRKNHKNNKNPYNNIIKISKSVLEDIFQDFEKQLSMLKQKELFVRINKFIYYARQDNSKYVFEEWEKYIKQNYSEFYMTIKFYYSNKEDKFQDQLYKSFKVKQHILNNIINLGNGVDVSAREIKNIYRAFGVDKTKNKEKKGEKLETVDILIDLFNNEEIKNQNIDNYLLRIGLTYIYYRGLKPLYNIFKLYLSGGEKESNETIKNLKEHRQLELLDEMYDYVIETLDIKINYSSDLLKYVDKLETSSRKIDLEKEMIRKYVALLDTDFENKKIKNTISFINNIFINFLLTYCLEIQIKKTMDLSSPVPKSYTSRIKWLESFLNDIVDIISYTHFYQDLLNTNKTDLSTEDKTFLMIYEDIEDYVYSAFEEMSFQGLENRINIDDSFCDNQIDFDDSSSIDSVCSIIQGLSNTPPGSLYYYIYKNLYEEEYKNKLGGILSGVIMADNLSKVDMRYSPHHNIRVGEIATFVLSVLEENLSKLPFDDQDYINEMKKDFKEILKSPNIQKQLDVCAKVDLNLDINLLEGKKDLDWKDINLLVASFHDLAKIDKISPLVLSKLGKLSEQERKQIQKHTDGDNMLNKLFPNEKNNLNKDKLKLYMRNYMIGHHRNYDGTGYGMLEAKGKDITLESRVGKIADVIDAILGERFYQHDKYKTKNLDAEINKVLGELEKLQDKQFDGDIVKLLLENKDRFYRFLLELYN